VKTGLVCDNDTALKIVNIVKKINVAVDEFSSILLLFTDDGRCIQAREGRTDHDWWFSKPFRLEDLTEMERQDITAAMRSLSWQAREDAVKS
jgi:hypothetical protein